MKQSQKTQIYLASGSPRRAELLTQMGVSFERLSVNVDEALKPQEDVCEYVSRLALEKAIEGGRKALDKTIPVLGADTAIFVNGLKGSNGETLGKPRDYGDACRMMNMLSGSTHQVLTAVALVDEKIQLHIVQTTYVTMRDISEKEIEAYWKTGEPLDKAGGYAIQGSAAVFISKIEGSYSGVMGLPIFETANLLADYRISSALK